MHIQLYNTHLQILRFDVKVFSPSAFWQYLQRFSSRWDKPRYAMTLARSGKQTQLGNRIKANLRINDLTQLSSDVYLGKALTRLKQLVGSSGELRWDNANSKNPNILKLAMTQRFCQVENTTRQIHYGSKLTDSQGCLLVRCPFGSELKKQLDREVLASIGEYDFYSLMTQAFFVLIYHAYREEE